MSAWETPRELWAEWIARDESVPHPVWVSCDEFDEDLRALLERHPFLGATEATVATRAPASEVAAAITQSGANGASDVSGVFAAEPDEIEATQVRAVDPSFHVGIAGGGFEVEFEGLFIPTLTRPQDGTAPRVEPARAEIPRFEPPRFEPPRAEAEREPPALRIADPGLEPEPASAESSAAIEIEPPDAIEVEPSDRIDLDPRSASDRDEEPGTPIPVEPESVHGPFGPEAEPSHAPARRAGEPVHEDATELDVTDMVVADEADDEPAPVATTQPSVTEPANGRAARLPDPPLRERPREWWDDVFGEHYAALTRPDHVRLAQAEVEFFLQSSGLAPGARILDLGCGDGAHAIALAQRGYVVTGLDASPHQLALARHDAGQAAIEWVQADMRAPGLAGSFHGIVCFGTTLGYFDDDDHRRVLAAIRDLLEPGGRVLLQVVNRDAVVARLPARSWWQGDGCLVLDETSMNFFSNRIHVHRNVVFEDGRQYEHDMFIRAYTAHDLGQMCVDAGLRVLELSGSRHTRGRFYGATSPEIWLLAVRP